MHHTVRYPGAWLRFAVLAIFAILLFAVVTAHSAEPPVVPEAVERTAYVHRAIDGDTLVADVHLGLGVVLSKERIRVANFDAVELRATGGAQARAAADALVRGRVVTLRIDGREKYGRILAAVELPDGRDFAQVMALWAKPSIEIRATAQTIVSRESETQQAGLSGMFHRPSPAVRPLRTPTARGWASTARAEALAAPDWLDRLFAGSREFDSRMWTDADWERIARDRELRERLWPLQLTLR